METVDPSVEQEAKNSKPELNSDEANAEDEDDQEEDEEGSEEEDE